jgi:hypothetical protein
MYKVTGALISILTEFRCLAIGLLKCMLRGLYCPVFPYFRIQRLAAFACCDAEFNSTRYNL